MKEKSKLTFKQKQDAVEKLFRQYHRAKLKLYCLENTSFYPEISTSLVKERKHTYGKNSIAARLNQRIDDKDDLKKLISAFEIVINALSPESQVIINNEFILKKDSDWWNEYYRRATYYRMKTRALEEILFYVNIS